MAKLGEGRRLTLGDVCQKGSSNIAQKDLVDNEGKYPIYGASGFIKNVDFCHQKKSYIAVVKDGAGIGRTMLLPANSSVIGTMQYLIPKEDVDIDVTYLYYAIDSMNLAKYYSGATIPHIYYKDYQKEPINVPCLAIQREIANAFMKIDQMIDWRNQQLQKLDELVKSRFVEMFGKPGTDNFGWGLISLGEICQINPKKNTDIRLKEGLVVSFVPMSCVGENGQINAKEQKLFEDVKKGFTYFAENDVLFAKITPCMENGKGAVATGLINNIGFGSTEFHVIRTIENKTNPIWIYILTTFKSFRKEAAENMTGSAGQRRVPASFLENYKLSLPPLDLQNQFADFVTQVDKSKLAVQKSLEQLEILKKSLMQAYFG